MNTEWRGKLGNANDRIKCNKRTNTNTSVEKKRKCKMSLWKPKHRIATFFLHKGEGGAGSKGGVHGKGRRDCEWGGVRKGRRAGEGVRGWWKGVWGEDLGSPWPCHRRSACIHTKSVKEILTLPFYASCILYFMDQRISGFFFIFGALALLLVLPQKYKNYMYCVENILRPTYTFHCLLHGSAHIHHCFSTLKHLLCLLTLQ